MSLKSFHIFFVTVSVLLALGFGGWSLYVHLARGGMPYLVMGIASLAVGAGLVVYGVKMLRKLKHLTTGDIDVKR